MIKKRGRVNLALFFDHAVVMLPDRKQNRVPLTVGNRAEFRWELSIGNGTEFCWGVTGCRMRTELWNKVMSIIRVL